MRTQEMARTPVRDTNRVMLWRRALDQDAL